MRDYYDVLGVGRKASNDDIQKAYRDLARKYHPDMHQDEEAKQEAQEKFKEATAAFEVLGDQQKRAHYDRFGSAPQPGARRNPFHHGNPFENIYSSFFNDMMGRGRQQRRRKGENIFLEHEITLEDVLKGGEASIKYRKKKLCPDCNGSGGKFSKCSQCDGSGAKMIHGPNMSVRITCDTCGGSGESLVDTCTTCKDGFVEGEESTQQFKIPPGVADGMKFAFRGHGNPSPDGVSGDVVVITKLKPHDSFERDNNHVLHKVKVSYSQLVLGTEIEVPTLDGPESLQIPAGTEVGHEFVLSGKGLPSFNGRRTIYKRGNQLVRIELDIPKKPSDEYRQLIEDLAKLEQIGD